MLTPPCSIDRRAFEVLASSPSSLIKAGKEMLRFGVEERTRQRSLGDDVGIAAFGRAAELLRCEFRGFDAVILATIVRASRSLASRGLTSGEEKRRFPTRGCPSTR